VDWLTSIAVAGGSALVSAAATDAWESARSGMAHLFGRGGQRRRDAAERWADQTATAIEQAPESDLAATRERLALAWQQRLADLIEEYPEFGEDLRSWVQHMQALLPAAEQTWVNTFVARDHATQYNAPGGSITVTNQHRLPDSMT
jgi:hypothetical protein